MPILKGKDAKRFSGLAELSRLLFELKLELGNKTMALQDTENYFKIVELFKKK